MMTISKRTIEEIVWTEVSQVATPKIIAVDFDGTLVTDEYPKIGEARLGVINRLRYEAANGSYIIIWTCRTADKITEMREWLAEHDIPYNLINSNAPWIIEQWGMDNRKIYADEYWDDKAVRV
jgi:hydroxymethylpyrimidine pyrophosphatase-like HAD family hydrolase